MPTDTPPPARPTLKMIAERAGVTTATVSRALSHRSHHNPKTVEKIRRVAAEIGYTKHPLISALMSQVRNHRPADFSPVIALIHSHERDFVRPPVMQDLKNGIAERAAYYGYHIEEFQLRQVGMTPRRLMEILKARGIRIVIMEHYICNDAELVELDMDMSPFAAIAIKWGIDKPNLNKVDSNSYEGLRIAYTHALDRGYRRIGLLTNSMSEKLRNDMPRAAMHLMQQRHGDPTIPVFDQYLAPNYFPLLRAWITTHRLDCVLSPEWKVPDHLHQIGYRVPQDLGFANLDLSQDNPIHHSGIRPNWTVMGHVAVSQVVDTLNRNQLGVPAMPLATLVASDWVEGETLPSRLLPRSASRATPRKKSRAK